MLNKTQYHSYIEEQKLVYLAELMLRWPHLCYIKICHELFKGKLISFVATEKYYAANEGLQKTVIIKFPSKNISFNFMLKYFNIIVFKKRNIEVIEKLHPDYTFIPSAKLIKNDHEMCTIKNINRISAQFSYVICRHAHKKYFHQFNIQQLREDFESSKVDPIIYSGSDEKSSWIIPNNILWPENSEYYKQKKNRKKKDITPIKDFIQKQRAIGITQNKQLARLLDNFFPNFLTDQEMGHLLPAQQGNVISFEGERKQGQRLRGII